MMVSKRALFLGIAGMLAVLISGCATVHGNLEKSARQNYVRGNYDQAIFDAVQSLKIKPDYEESQALVKEVFPKAVDAHLGKIKEAKNGNAKFRWDTVVSEYDALIKINQAVKSLPALTGEKSMITIPFLKKEKSDVATTAITFDTQDYTQELSEAKTNAAEEHYQEGRRLFGKAGMTIRDQAAKEFGSANGFVPQYKDASTLAAEGYYQEGLLLSKNDAVDIQKQAAKAFKAAEGFVPGYKGASTLYDKARKAGIKRIAIIPFENKSGKGEYYGNVAETIVDGVVSNVMNDSAATEFLEIISRDQLERVMQEQKLGTSGLFDTQTVTKLGKLLGVSEILTGKITRITVTPERTTPTTSKKTKQVCTYETQNGKCVQYGTLTAIVTTKHRKAGAGIVGSYSVIDVKTAKLKETKQLDGKYEFAAAWATFTGDEEALSETLGSSLASALTGGDGNGQTSGALKKLLSTPEETAPVAEEMVGKAGEDLIAKLSKTLKDYTR